MAHKMPIELEPVLEFINSVDVAGGTDELADGPAATARWLRLHEMLPASSRVSAAEHRLVLDLRAGLRQLALQNNGVEPAEEVLGRMQEALGHLPLVLTIDGRLGAQRASAAESALSAILTGYAHAVASGQWQRLRLCPAEDCARGFWDSSPKGTRRWDVMGVCGNREKARAFARRRAGRGSDGSVR